MYLDSDIEPSLAEGTIATLIPSRRILIPAGVGWGSVQAFTFSMDVASRIDNRVFVGTSLCTPHPLSGVAAGIAEG